MTPADRLREAARVLRERAEAATPGPWWNDTSLHNVILSGAGLSTDVPVTEGFDKPADAEFIATMHPGVALALADWLDNMGRAIHGTSRGDVPFEGDAHRIVDLILGTEP